MEMFGPKTEEKILGYWQREQIFEKLRKKIKGQKPWSFLDGPITANNPMGVHHAWGRTYKDLFQRYRAMRGFDERFQNGFDAQGLWVEVEVEKELGFKSKKDIEKYGIAEFVEKCKERVRKYSEIQTNQSIRLGQWMDWKNSYYTMSNENNIAIWHFLKKCREKGLLYKGLDVVPWCWRCGTAISQHEILTEDYKEVAHDSVYIEYPIDEKRNAYLLVWTTTPWTLPGNAAVAIDPDKIYVEATGEVKDNIYYLVKSAAEKLNLKIVRIFKGKELIGLIYKSPFDNLPAVRKTLSGFTHKVVATDSRILPVSETEGTGLIHIAPGQGVEDYRLGKKLKIPAINLIDDMATYLKGLGRFSGKNAKEHPEIIIDYLKTSGFLFGAPKYTHRYPVCWRCKTELVWKIADEWYISMDKLRKPLIEVAKKIKWIPSFGLEREIDWLKNMSDWLISKKRYWGLALPIFECRCGHFEVIGSLSDFDKLSAKKLNNYIFLRHGESENNRQKIVSSYPEKKNYPLTIEGAKEIEKLIPWLANHKIDLIFSSDILRAKETAQIIAGALGKIVTYDKRIRENDFGVYNGRTHKEWHSLFGRQMDQHVIKPSGGENLKDVQKRMMDFLLSIDEKYDGKTILIVSHANPIVAAATAYQGYGNGEAFEKFNIDGVTGAVIEMAGHNWSYNNEGDLDLHRPYVDKIKIKCPKCGKKTSRILDVGNPWLDAGIVPYSTMGYFENKKFWRKWFPAELVCESFPGQFKNWFYSLIVMSTVLEKTPPMRTVFCYASVRDEKGEEMHKSKGNAIWFDEAAERMGVDVMRWLYVKQNPADNLKFGYGAGKESERKLMNLWNSFMFFKTYTTTQRSDLKNPRGRTSILDKWILSRLNNLIEKVTKNLDKYNPASGARAIEEFFIDDLSLWYIRRSRGRFQKPKSEREKEEAAETLYLILHNLVKVIAPFLPFLSEEIYLFLKNTGMPKSVHLCDWPQSNRKFIDLKLEKQMDLIREISAKGLALRAEAGIKVRQPLAKLQITNYKLQKNPKSQIPKALLDLIREEVNVKEIVFGDKFELDTKITSELKEEGIVRDLARQIQEMRKDAGLTPKDFIKIYFKIDIADLKNIILKRQKNLIFDTGAKTIEFLGAIKDGVLIDRHFEVENKPIWIGVEKML